MTFSSEYSTLQLFIDKAAELENSRFMKSILKEFSLDVIVEPNNPIQVLQVISTRPDQEDINGFILPFRFFVEKNDGIAIIEPHNQPLKDIFSSDFVTDQEREKFHSVIREINVFLSERADIEMYGETITNKVMMEVFMYGRLSHGSPSGRNKEKKQKFDLWMSMVDTKDVLWHNFFIIIICILQAIQCIRDIFRKVIFRRNISSYQIRYRIRY